MSRSSSLVFACLVSASWIGSALSAPVLQGPPLRALTDPKSIGSPALLDAAPVPIADLFFNRTSYFAAWSAHGSDVFIATDLTGRINLWSVPAKGGFPQQLTQSDDKQFFPTVTPDGRWLIYASDREGHEIYDLYAVPTKGGQVIDLTNSDDASETSPLAAPDSHMIAYDSRLKTEPSSNVAVMDLSTKAVRLLTHEKTPNHMWHVVAFASDGKTLYVNRSDLGMTQSVIWRIEVATGQANALTAGVYDAANALSPDGRLLSVTTETPAGDRQAALLDIQTGKMTLLAPDPWEQHAGVFSPDGRTVLFTRNLDGRTIVQTYDLARGKATPLALPDGVNSDYFGLLPSFSPDGSKLLFPHQAGNTPFDYWIYNLASKEAKPLTRLGLASIDPARLPKTQIVHYPSADGTVISAVLWTPFNLRRDGHAPAVVMVHGGPTFQTEDTFDATAVALASRGYMVIAPNPRGSTGYGRAFQLANIRDLGGGDLEDEVYGGKFMTATGYVDPTKIGITGASYGGYMTFMALGRTPTLWAAGVEEFGVVNRYTMYKNSSPANREYQVSLIGDPVKDKAVYDKVSPITYLANTRSPLLVLQGDNDIRIPKEEAVQAVDVLKAHHVTVDAHFYPGEGHGLEKREDQIDALERTIQWFDRYLQGDAGVNQHNH